MAEGFAPVTSVLATKHITIMSLTTRSVLYHQDGTPFEPWTGQVDLSTTEWEVHEIELPEWLSTEEYCTSYLKWKYFWGLGANPEWPETWQRLLTRKGLSTADRLACIQLLKTKKFRSEFRKGLHAQLVNWLNEERYPYPFSPKQWDKLVNKYVTWEADRLEAAIQHYHNCGVPRPNSEVRILVENLKPRA
jgi:hypothetical protein